MGADVDAISDARDVAAASDTIEVSTGFYARAIDFDGKELTLIGVYSADVTTIIGDDGDPVARLRSGDCAGAVLASLTLQTTGA